MTIGKIPIFIRGAAVVRSRNISLVFAFQSVAMAHKVYGKEETDTLFDNCSTLVFLGSQSAETLRYFSDMGGEETVYARTFSRNFSTLTPTVSESVTSSGRAVLSLSQLRMMEKGKALIILGGHHPILDDKYPTTRHPLYAYIPEAKAYPRKCNQPLPRIPKRFDIKEHVIKERYGSKTAERLFQEKT